MADVEVGQVRRALPQALGLGPDCARRYLSKPFRVLRVGSKYAGVIGLDGRRERDRLLASVAKCPLWPSEHEQYKNARGYEVKP